MSDTDPIVVLLGAVLGQSDATAELRDEILRGAVIMSTWPYEATDPELESQVRNAERLIQRLVAGTSASVKAGSGWLIFQRQRPLEREDPFRDNPLSGVW